MDNINIKAEKAIQLCGNKVYLKGLDSSYIDEYWRLIDGISPKSKFYTGTQAVFTKPIVANYLENISTDSSRVDFLIFSKDSNILVGEVVINDISRNNRCGSIRILIAKEEDFNKGYGSEAMVLALNYGFGFLNLHRIELDALEFNERAIHVYEKLGFKVEGVLRDTYFMNHRYYNSISMSIIEDEFREKHL